MRSLLGITTATASLLVMACAGQPSPPASAAMAAQEPRPAESPELVEVAHAAPAAGERALLVAYPRTACSGSARTVFLDANGAFLGAIAPGEATLLTLPLRTRTLIAVSSVEIVAPTRTRFSIDEVDVPPSPDALLLETTRISAKQCSKTGQYSNTAIVSKQEIENRLADAQIAWLEPRRREGQAWIDAHRARVDELLGRNR